VRIEEVFPHILPHTAFLEFHSPLCPTKFTQNWWINRTWPILFWRQFSFLAVLYRFKRNWSNDQDRSHFILPL